MKIQGFVWGVLAAGFGAHGVAQNGAQIPETPRFARSAPLPQGFVPNLGQWSDRAAFRAKLDGKTAFLERNGWTLVGFAAAGQPATDEPAAGAVRAVALRLSFGDEGGPGPRGEAASAARQHYFLGSDPANWRSDVPSYGSVLYERARPGIDVRFYQGDHQGRGQFAFDVLVAPDAAAADFSMRVEGMERMRLDDGRLVLETELGPVHLTPPVAWEEDGAHRVPIQSRFVLRGAASFGFEVGKRTPGRRLVIDPGIVWSTSFGGSDIERAETCATDLSGGTCVGGYTYSADFPVTVGAFDTTFGNQDAFVTRLSPTGAIQFATYLGGSVSQYRGPFGAAPFDEVQGIAVDGQGRIFVAGTTMATDYPTTPGAFRSTAAIGGTNVFATRLAANGASLDYSTYVWLGRAEALAVDAQGQAVIVGTTNNQYWPTTVGAISSTLSGPSDGFVTRVGPTGAWLSYSTFLGGSAYDEPSAVAIDAQGRVVVAGSTQSSNLPTTPTAFDPSYNFGSFVWDGFVLRFGPNFTGIDYCSYLGGTDNDYCLGVAADVQGEVVVTGWTLSSNFPTTPGAYDTTFGAFGAPAQVVVTRFAANGSNLVGSTFVGGTSGQIARGCVVDARGDVTIVGNSGTGFVMTPGAADTTFDGGYNDAFVARLRADLTGLVYSSYLPGSGFDDIATAVGIGPAGQAIVTGFSNFDVFVMACDLLPTGATAFGASSPGCNGPQWIGVDSMPSVGNSGFTITLGNALPFAVGIMAFTDLGLSVPVQVSGVDAWLDLSTVIALPMLAADARGRVDADVPIPSNPTLVSLELNTQFAWNEPFSPAPCPASGTSASNALQIVIQP
ncbi:MAG: SBBP repeat-containing protein [Planctomycetota bacterium]